MFRVKQYRHQNDVIGVARVSFLLTFNVFTFYSSAFIVKFEKLHAGWDMDPLS